MDRKFAFMRAASRRANSAWYTLVIASPACSAKMVSTCTFCEQKAPVTGLLTVSVPMKCSFSMFSNPTRHAFMLLQTVNKRVTCLSLWDSVRNQCSSPSILQCDHAILHFEESSCIAHDFLQHFNQFRRFAY